MNLLFAAMVVLPGPFQILPAELEWAAVDRAYTQALEIRGGVNCAENDVRVRVDGMLPEGVDVTDSGRFTGVPRRTGIYPLLVRVRNTCGESMRRYNLVVTGAPVLVVPQEDIEFHYRKGGPSPGPQLVQVRSTWPGREYGIEKAGVPWLRAEAQSGRTPRNGAAVNCDLVEITADPGDLAAGVYQATLRLWTWQGANAPAIHVRLIVE
jgi:hypothetical protein